MPLSTPIPSTQSPETKHARRDPIATGACCRSNCGPNVARHTHSWLWVPARPRGACHRAALCADPLARLAGTTEIVDSNFKQPGRVPNRHCEPTGRANARPMTGSAKQSIAAPGKKVDCFADARNDENVSVRPHSRGANSARVVRESFASKNEGAGKAGCPLHPQPRVQK
jgi:hypothetical protein